MEYNEKADLDQHQRDVSSLAAVASGAGIRVNGYANAIDIGGGLGLHAPWLQLMADKVYVTDIIDYTKLYDGKFINLLGEKFARNGVVCDSARTEYHKVDAQSLIYKDDLFDLIFSVNAFEHIPDPQLAFQEIVRVSKAGALVMLQFDPLWCSSQGHHLWNLNLPPWTHLILSRDEMHAEIRKSGGGDNEIHIYDHETNRQPLSIFMEIFTQRANVYFDNIRFNYWAKDPADEVASRHPNYQKCLSLGYNPLDLLVRGIQFIGVRK